MIYKHGGFGPGHALAVLTLLALTAGFLVTKVSAITDGLLRLPVGNPVLTDPQDPLLKKFYLAFFAVFLVGYALQVRWLRKQNQTTPRDRTAEV